MCVLGKTDVDVCLEARCAHKRPILTVSCRTSLATGAKLELRMGVRWCEVHAKGSTQGKRCMYWRGGWSAAFFLPIESKSCFMLCLATPCPPSSVELLQHNADVFLLCFAPTHRQRSPPMRNWSGGMLGRPWALQQS